MVTILTYCTMFTECLRKRARGDVTLVAPGTGKISINDKPITYFGYDQCREQVSETICRRCGISHLFNFCFFFLQQIFGIFFIYAEQISLS